MIILSVAFQFLVMSAAICESKADLAKRAFEITPAIAGWGMKPAVILKVPRAYNSQQLHSVKTNIDEFLSVAGKYL